MLPLATGLSTQKSCAYCHADNPLYSCGRCGTKYKSRACQVADWSQHRRVCSALANAQHSSSSTDAKSNGEGEEVRCAFCRGEYPSFSCARCGTKYKSRACQKADWQQHKKICSALAEKKADSGSAAPLPNHADAENKEGTEKEEDEEEEEEDDEEEVKYCCTYCQGDNPSFACGRCGTKYLSQHCQAADWPNHRKICASLSLLKEERSAAKKRLRAGLGSLNDRLYNACLLGRLAAASRLIADGGNVDAFNSAGSTCLIAGAIGRQPRLVDVLVRKHAASLDQPSTAGITALMVAAQGGCTSVVKVLLAAHACTQVRTVDGNSALDFAAACDHADVVSLLVSHTLPGSVPVPVDACDHLGVSALGKACARGSLAAVEVLLQHGANPLLTAKDGNTPLSAAKHFGRSDCVPLLEARIMEMEMGLAGAESR